MDIAQEAPHTVFVAQDEASLYLQTTTMAVWAARGCSPVVRAAPSRLKTNFYGSLNLLTGEELVTQADEMNAQATVRHLQHLLDATPAVPILLLWDRAPWHKGQPIRDLLAANPRLTVMNFPVASPDLNPQEHVWKATRRAISHNHLLPRLPDLADRFHEHLMTHTFSSSFLERYGFTPLRMRFI